MAWELLEGTLFSEIEGVDLSVAGFVSASEFYLHSMLMRKQYLVLLGCLACVGRRADTPLWWSSIGDYKKLCPQLSLEV